MRGFSNILKDAFAIFCTALRFLTVVPVTYRVAEDDSRFLQSVAFFPVVGIVIGILALLLTLLLQSVFPHMVTVFLLIFFLSSISNFLHLDGIADSGDGLFSSRDRIRSLEIMRDSRIGAMGVAILIFLLLGKFAALSSIAPNQLPLVIFCMPIAGRMALLITLATIKYARSEGGVASLFYSSACRKYALIWSGIFAIVIPLFLGLFGVILCIALLAALFLFNSKCKKQLGGATGDTIGAQSELAELVVALCFSMQPIL